ncbi:UNVERIFIED_CONTAM: aph1 [Trichonephila clavipes]
MKGNFYYQKGFILKQEQSRWATTYVLVGRVLDTPVTPIRIAKRLQDMHQHEVADLFMCVQTVQKKIEEAYSASSSSIAIQDGPEAGQTVPHLHVHILPRKSGDFKENDDVYTKS